MFHIPNTCFLDEYENGGVCTTCPGGSSCSNGADPDPCSEGEYSTVGMLTCEQVKHKDIFYKN